ncbi:hypothetical protein V8G54_004252 [Vigna mungo]|uniref:Uncharacterized protein n=1 Tax=Vigna mungo TaxID=3915 RepID=A0AAQ3PCB5_VIGMU
MTLKSLNLNRSITKAVTSQPIGLNISLILYLLQITKAELLGHGRTILSTRKFSRNSWVTDNQSRLLGGSPGTPGPRTNNFVYWEVLQELLGGSPGTPGPRTNNFVYWEVLQELLGHRQSITSTRRFSRNSWATNGQFCLLGSSPGTPGSRTINHVYSEVIQELLGHGRTILSTGKFSRNSWVTENQSRLLGGSPGTPGPRTVNYYKKEQTTESERSLTNRSTNH